MSNSIWTQKACLKTCFEPDQIRLGTGGVIQTEIGDVAALLISDENGVTAPGQRGSVWGPRSQPWSLGPERGNSEVHRPAGDKHFAHSRLRAQLPSSPSAPCGVLGVSRGSDLPAL